MKNPRGVYEKEPGSGVWWICYFDAEGKKRREKVGSKSAAITLVGLRKAAIWEGVKLPKTMRAARAVRFSELADDYLKGAREKSRVLMLKAAFGERPSDRPTFRLLIFAPGSMRVTGSRRVTIACGRCSA